RVFARLEPWLREQRNDWSEPENVPRRASGPGALVVTELADHAALDHGRALRALLAGDPAGLRASRETPGLLDFSGNGFDRQSHQRSGDLGLRRLIVGNSDRGEDRFIQRRWIAPNAPG